MSHQVAIKNTLVLEQQSPGLGIDRLLQFRGDFSAGVVIKPAVFKRRLKQTKSIGLIRFKSFMSAYTRCPRKNPQITGMPQRHNPVAKPRYFKPPGNLFAR
jgi:hypothetical protein